MTAPPPLVLKKLERERLGPINEALGKHRQLSFKLWGQSYRMEVFQQLDAFEPDFTLNLELLEETLALSFRHFPQLEHFSKKLEGLSLDTLPNDLNQVVLNYILGKLLDEIETRYHHSTVLNSFHEGPPTQAYPHSLYARIFNEKLSTPVDVCFQAQDPLFRKLIALMSEMPLTPLENFAQISFDFTIEYGRFDLPLDQVKPLALGDILLVGPDCYPRHDTLCLSLPKGLRVCAQVVDGTATVTDIMSETETTPEPPAVDEPKAPAQPESSAEKAPPSSSQSAAARAPATAGAPLEQLPVTVSFDVGHKTFSLEELKSLKPGYTFSFEQEASKPIFIRANGRLLGHGELVQIEEHVGVRIVGFIDHAIT